MILIMIENVIFIDSWTHWLIGWTKRKRKGFLFSGTKKTVCNDDVFVLSEIRL